jgi:hypothetical protein
VVKIEKKGIVLRQKCPICVMGIFPVEKFLSSVKIGRKSKY